MYIYLNDKEITTKLKSQSHTEILLNSSLVSPSRGECSFLFSQSKYLENVSKFVKRFHLRNCTYLFLTF